MQFILLGWCCAGLVNEDGTVTDSRDSRAAQQKEEEHAVEAEEFAV